MANRNEEQNGSTNSATSTSDVNKLIETVTLNHTHTNKTLNTISNHITTLADELRALRQSFAQAQREKEELQEVIQQLRDERAFQSTITPSTITTPILTINSPTFRIGDCVQIINDTNPRYLHRFATVTATSATRIYLHIDELSINTWRAPNKIRKSIDEEKRQHMVRYQV